MKKNVLIFGGNSLLARDVHRLLSRNCGVVTAGRRGCEVFTDVCQRVEIPDGIDTVINCAAHFGGRTDDSIEAAVETNVMGLLKICKAASRSGIKHIVNISSIFATLPPTSPSYTAYAFTKKHGDELAEYYCALNHLPLLTLRPSRIYGDSIEFARNQPFLYHMIDRAERGEEIVIYGSNDPVRNYIHSLDVAEVIARSLECGLTGTYACTFPQDRTYSEIAGCAGKVFGANSGLSFARDKPDIPDDAYFFDSSLYDRIGFVPGISMELGLGRIKQHRERGIE